MPDTVEIIELADHPWFLAVQFHPEFKSKPTKAHPLFAGFIKAAMLREPARRFLQCQAAKGEHQAGGEAEPEETEDLQLKKVPLRQIKLNIKDERFTREI